MKIQVTFKSPDALGYALEDLSDEDKARAKKVASLFFEYDEYVTVELDLDEKTCVVVPYIN